MVFLHWEGSAGEGGGRQEKITTRHSEATWCFEIKRKQCLYCNEHSWCLWKVGHSHWQWLHYLWLWVHSALQCCYLKLSKCCHYSIICLWDIWLLSDKRKCLMIMGFLYECALSSIKKKPTKLFKDLYLLTLRKKRSFKKFYFSLTIAVLAWLSIRGK